MGLNATFLVAQKQKETITNEGWQGKRLIGGKGQEDFSQITNQHNYN